MNPAEREYIMKIAYQKNETLTIVKSSAEEMEIGAYGRKWLDFMRTNYADLVQEMQSNGTLYKVAHSVDETAWAYRELLDKQYTQLHPRPKGFENVVAWERTRIFYTDGAVMRERILIPYTSV